MGSLKEVQFSGCLGHHGQYSFYKYVKIDGRVLALSSFFPVRIYPNSAIFSIAEVQLLWSDRAENFVSLRLYFLPENTPEGRLRHHGEDEVIALQDKVIIRASDLSSWLVEESEWDWGYVLPSGGGSGDTNKIEDAPESAKSTSQLSSSKTTESNYLKRAFPRDRFLKSEKNRDTSLESAGSSRVLVVNYQRYVRVRTLVKRLEGSSDLSNWLSDPLVLALGGLNVGPDCRLLFSKEVFDYPELEDHELLCNHLAPKLKGRPRKRTRKRDFSGESESNNSTSSATSVCSEARKKPLNGVLLINSNAVDLGKQQVTCESPKSITSEESHGPNSPPDKLASGNEENDAPLNETNDPAPILNSVDKVEALPSVEVNSNSNVESPKNGKFRVHQPKKRKGIRLTQKLATLETVVPPIEPEIELESTTIKVTTPPVMMNQVTLSIPSPPPTNTTTIPNVPKDLEPQFSVGPLKSELLEPSLLQLAKKLEKSNAIQILPVRPSVITKQPPTPDMECNGIELPLKKSRNTESIPSVTVKEVPVSQGKVNYLRISASGPKRNERMSPLGPSFGDSDKIVSGNYKGLSVPFTNKVNINSEVRQPYHGIIQPAHVVSTTSDTKCSNNRDFLEKPSALSITAIETDSKRHNVFPMSWGSPSPFLPTSRIYGDPSIKVPSSPPKGFLPRQPKSNAVVPTVRSNGVSITQAHNEGVLDFSVKRQKLSSYQIPDLPVVVAKHNGNNGDCLDLRLSKARSLSNRNVYHTISDIPPPNAVTQLGLQLTSEVTLFPSHQKQKQQQSKRQSSPQAPAPVKRSNNHLHDPTHHGILKNNQFPSPSPSSEYHPTQAQINNYSNTASRQTRLPSPSHSKQRTTEFQQQQADPQYTNRSNLKISAHNPHNQSNQNSRAWKAPATTTSTVLPSSGIPSTQQTNSTSSRRNSNHAASNSNQAKYTNKAPMTHQPMTDQRRQASTHSSTTPPKPSPTSAMPVIDHHRRYRHPSDTNNRERNRSHSSNSEQLQISSPYGNFVLPTTPPTFNYSYPPNMGPYFASPFAAPPYGMNPALMRFQPGTMEALQLAYMQQGYSPHMINWPGPGRESSRSGTQK